MQKQIARIVLLMLPLVILASVYARPATGAELAVSVDGVRIQGTHVEMVDGQAMVAVRPFVEAMGGYVSWLQATQRATIFYQGMQVAFWVGSNTAFVNGEQMWAPVAPYIRDGSTMVPAWWVAVRLGARVDFTGATLVVISKPAQSNPRPVPGTIAGSPLADPAYVFPFPRTAAYQPYVDSWGDPRSYQGQQFHHEGTDIMAKKGTPMVSVAPGVIVRYGWNTLGGYRLTIQVDGHPEYRLYYAHMDRYASGIYLGSHVRTGQLLGYVGNTGEGPERTEGKFVTHLHFGIYAPEGAINPYPFLQYWEQHKAGL